MMKNYSKTLLLLGCLLLMFSSYGQEPDFEKRKAQIDRVLAAKNENQIVSPKLIEMAEGQAPVDKDMYIMKGRKMAMIARCKDNVKALAKELKGLGASDMKVYKHTVTFYMNVKNASKMQAC